MTTIIIRKNKDGVVIGRCDARCYNAKGKKCHCVCGGDNHGKGLNAAIMQTSRHSELLQDLFSDDKTEVKQGQFTLFEEVKL